MKTQYKTVRLALLIICAMVVYACSTSDDNEPLPEETTINITLNQTTLEMNVGGEEQLIISGTGGRQISWSSSDPTVATVTDGTVTTLKGGKTTITAQLGNASANCSVEVEPDIFMTGIVFDAEGYSTGYYWKNGIAIPLSDVGSSLRVNSIYVDGNDSYVVGSGYLGSNLGTSAILWKNGQATALSDGSKNAGAMTVYVAGGDVYVVGYERAGSESTAILWKNGLKMALPDNNGNAEANAIAVVDGDVHIVGTYQGSSGDARAAYWKNGVLIPLGNDALSFANDIFIDQGDIYITGMEENQVTYWKNGSPLYVAHGTLELQGTSIFTVEDDLFITGNRVLGSWHDDIGMLWKNGTDVSPTFMPTTYKRVEANGVAVWNKDVHVVGFTLEGSNVVGHYWKNGQIQPVQESLGAFIEDLFIR